MRHALMIIPLTALMGCGGPETGSTPEAALATSSPIADAQSCPTPAPLVFYYETVDCTGTRWATVDRVAMPWAPMIMMRSLYAPDGCRELVAVSLAAQVRSQ